MKSPQCCILSVSKIMQSVSCHAQTLLAAAVRTSSGRSAAFAPARVGLGSLAKQSFSGNSIAFKPLKTTQRTSKIAPALSHFAPGHVHFLTCFTAEHRFDLKVSMLLLLTRWLSNDHYSSFRKHCDCRGIL